LVPGLHHSTGMSHARDRKPRRGTKYRDLAAALLLLTALALLMAGVTAARLGLITVEVKIGVGPRAAIPKMTVAAPTTPPPPRRAAVPEGPTPVAAGAPEPLSATAPAPAPARLARELIPSIEMAKAAVPRDAPAAPVKAAAFTPPGKLLASAAGEPTRVVDCTTVSRPANTDPTEGEISGTMGLPDHVIYFKLGEKTPPCRPVARTVSSAR